MALASESTEAEVLLKAIALYEIALRAKLMDQNLAILNDERYVVSEIDGF